MTDDAGIPREELQRRLDYYKRQLDKLAGENVRKDYALAAARQEIKQKRTGFALLAELQRSLGACHDTLAMLDTAMHAIHVALGMARTVVLMPAAAGAPDDGDAGDADDARAEVYQPVRWIGLTGAPDAGGADAERLAAVRIALPAALAAGTGWLLVNKATPASPVIEQIRAALDLPFFVCVPVHADGRTIGVLVTGRLKEVVPTSQALNEGDVETLAAIAGLIANIVQNQQIAVLEQTLIALRDQQLRVGRELTAARAIQQALLPPVPMTVAGLELDALYHPSEELSGDFFDHAVVDGWLYFYVADVTSHGTAAAQVTYLVKGLFQEALRTGAAPSLEDMLTFVQRRYAAYNLDYDVAIQLVRVHAGGLRLDYLSANAPPAVRIRGGDIHPIVVPPSPILTAQPAERPVYRHRTLELSPGDRLYFYTDGCYEFTIGGRPFGTSRLARIYRELPDRDWRGAALAAISAAHGGPTFADDVTIVRLSVAE